MYFLLILILPHGMELLHHREFLVIYAKDPIRIFLSGFPVNSIVLFTQIPDRFNTHFQ